ncbi:MAG: LPXTG cell wall anchor domain-containing protein [Lachnospiraceae bacterium]|nr:LPXTG cell wall anchor domain-containing protein [Lachnospiraceae bacterium]
MQKFVKDYLNELTRQKKRHRKAAIAVVLLAVLVIGGVAGILERYGVAMTGQAVCGIEEHKHSDACYEEALICGREAAEAHTHGEACYVTETSLSCGQEEGGHIHDDTCYQTESSPVLVCSQEEGEEHSHGEECYDTETASDLMCGQEEGGGHTHGDACYTETKKLVCGTEEAAAEAHTHGDTCYEEKLTCEKEEHEHEDACYAGSQEEEEPQPENVEEDPGQWEEQYAQVHWKDAWGADLVTAARMQLGYEEKVVILEDGSEKTYTRYGHFEDDKYLENWDAAFVNFCMYYAGLSEAGVFADATDAAEWQSEFENAGADHKDYLISGEDYTPEAGDLVFLKEAGEEEQMGIVSSYDDAAGQVDVIQGNSEGRVEENTYGKADDAIDSYLKVSELEDDCKNEGSGTEDHETDEEPAEEEDVASKQQVEDVIALIEALPALEQVTEKFTALQEAEDEEGYDAYYQELQKQVMEAYRAYEALTDEQKEAVTNRERLQQFEWLLSDTMEETLWNIMKPDEAYVNEVKITSVSTGAAPFDDTEGRGNDTSAEDDLVRTFDIVTYNFSVNMKSWDSSKSYGQARVKLEFVLPLKEAEAVFEQTAMAWMDQTEGYQPVVTTETRTIDGKETECQVLTCYKLLFPAEGNHSVVPGDFGENLTIYIRSMKNGQTFTPVISAAMEGGAWDGPCDKEDHKIDGQPAVEKKTVTPDPVEVTAAPKYNIQVKGDSSYADDFNFRGDDAWMQQYGNVAANTDIEKPLPGRAMKLGITLQLYNDNASKGLKGIELPDGSDITFDLELSSRYTINTPKENSGYTVGQEITDSNYAPLLWSYNEVDWKDYGSQNKDGRRIDDRLKATPFAPYNYGGGENACYNGGNWTASQEGDTIHITVSGYEIDPQKMPTLNGDGGIYVTYGANVGCFSAGEIWLIQPFNKKEGMGTKPNYDIVDTYGSGFFATTAEAKSLKVTTVSGETLEQGVEGFQQMLADDDRETHTLELTLEGYLQNRVRYGDAEAYELGCGIADNRDGRDFAAVGSELNLMGGLSYNPNQVEENRMYLGTTLVKFYGSALELEEEDWFLHLEGGAALNGHDEKEISEAEKNVRFYYAVKEDGSDWKDDNELKTTYEDKLIFYDSLDKIPAGKTCVGMLICFVGPGGDVKASDPYYRCYHKAKVRDDMDLAGQTFMLASTSRLWTKGMFEEAGLGLDAIDLSKNPDLNVADLIVNGNLWKVEHYTSANIENSVFYEKEVYRPDGSGIEGTHNSDWYHWGDTLLIIGYKTKITKNLLQTDENGNEKKIFSLDADQRVADFKLQPASYYDKPGEFEHTAKITVVDILPKHMTYKPGSAYFGGAYEQTSALGGTKGTIVRDETPNAAFPDPVLTEPVIKKNADGTSTLTWVIEDVKIGNPMPPIYYSTDIGVRGNPEEDIDTGTNNLTNKAYITTPRDLRDPETTEEKHAEAGITVIRGSASSFGKYTRQKVADEDGVIEYVVYFNNNADTGTVVQMMDTMPMNQVSGSKFTGTYTLAEWKLDVSKCDAAKLKIYYTFDKEYQDKTSKDILWEKLEESDQWKAADIRADGTIAIPTEAEGAAKEQPYPTAWVVIGALESGKSVNIDLKLQLEPGASDTNKTENNYFVNRLSSGDTTTTTETPTVRRTLEGVTWMDYNQNGLQDELQTEIRISGIRVELLKLKEGGDPENENDYENVYYPNTDPADEKNKIIIETGQQISLRAENESKKTPYEEGRYKFTDLPAGTFAVRFTDGSGETKITELNASKPNCGTDDTLDSDGIPVYENEESDKLQRTVILNVEMPKAEDMSVSLYESKNHDSGFYPDTQMKIQKADEGGSALSGAIFTIRDSRNNSVVSFTYDEEKGCYEPVIIEETDPALDGKYYIAYAANPDYVVEISGNWDGAVPILKKRNGNAFQLFEIKDQGGDLRSFLNAGSGKWLDLDGGKLENGAKIHVWSNDNPNDNQIWHVTDAGGGSHIWPKASSSAYTWHMDLSGGNVSEGTSIQLWSANDSAAQKWILVPAGSGGSGDDAADARTDLSVDSSGSFTIQNLVPGSYTIEEIKSPTGYSLLKGPVSFTLNTDNTITVNSDMVSAQGEGENLVLKVKNEKLYALPKTGGRGTFVYTISGTLLMLAAALILYKKKEIIKSRQSL